MIRTFIDAGVLIYAARSQGDLAERAFQILEDENREFASSIFLKLEVLPKAIYNQQSSEVKFYETFLGRYVAGGICSSHRVEQFCPLV